jgi:hypothetical protein
VEELGGTSNRRCLLSEYQMSPFAPAPRYTLATWRDEHFIVDIVFRTNYWS